MVHWVNGGKRLRNYFWGDSQENSFGKNSPKHKEQLYKTHIKTIHFIIYVLHVLIF